MNPKWEKICKISNVCLSVFYVMFWEFFGFVGFWFMTLAKNAVMLWSGIGIGFLLTPLSCILGIVLSVRFRKKQKYGAAFLIQFLPAALFRFELILFILLIWF